MSEHLDAGQVFPSADGVTSPLAYSNHAKGGTILSLSMPEATSQMLDRLAVEAGQPLEHVIGKALILYRKALQAQREGKSVGIAASPEALETEFVGL